MERSFCQYFKSTFRVSEICLDKGVESLTATDSPEIRKSVNTILGGNDRQTIIQGCIPDTDTCPPKKTQDPNDKTCENTNTGTSTLGNVTGGGFADSNRCGG